MAVLNNTSRIAVLGASRGLGQAVASELVRRAPSLKIKAVARRPGPEPYDWMAADLSQPVGQTAVLSALADFGPERIVCAVGGGPYGNFQDRAWRDHQWCLEVSFLFPARLLHWALAQPQGRRPQQVVLIGSSVAESNPDVKAATYSAAKHGLRGLWATLREEQPEVDVRLFSPGYMDTALLPPNTIARQGALWSPRDVAVDLLEWLDSGPRFDHRCLAVRPSGR